MRRRLDTVKTEKRGVLALASYCNENNLIWQGEPEEDYGIDGYVEVQKDQSPLAFFVGVQVKAGSSHKRHRDSESFSVGLNPRDVAYWMASNIPIVFVYYDADAQMLYWRHVQKEASDGTPPKRFRFAADEARDVTLASYLRSLPSQTPATGDRRDVLSAAFRVGTHALSTRGEIPAPPELPDFSPEVLLGYQASTVLAYERDHWVLWLDVVDHGVTDCDERDLVLTRLSDNAEMRIPITCGEHAPDDLVGDQIQTEISRTCRDAARTLCRVAPALEAAADLLKPPSVSSVEPDPPTLRIAFGSVVFDLRVTPDGQQTRLELVAKQFTPARRVVLLSPRSLPSTLLPPEGSEEPDLQPYDEGKRLDTMYGAWLNPEATCLSVAVATNDDHVCVGTRDYFVLHFKVSDLRRRCFEALR